jgi:transcriptional regulator with XRE-family HTH domain
MDYDEISADFVRALRGKRSQTAFCRRLGYKSNVVYTWESKRGWPTAARMMAAVARTGIDLGAAFEAFYRMRPAWMAENDPTSPEGIAAFLNDLRGNTSIVELANYCGRNRFAISRWLKGTAEPKLPEFFLLIESCSLRLLDFIGVFVDPSSMPSIAEPWQELQIARRVAYDAPWTQAVLRALEMAAYRALPRHELGWIARQVGISRDEEVRCLGLLARSAQIRWEDEHWVIDKMLALDTRSDPKAARQLKAWWAQVGTDRLAAGAKGFNYNLLGVSRTDFQRLKELQKAYFNELRTIVAQSQPVECVALATVQLLDLTDGAEEEAPVRAKAG